MTDPKFFDGLPCKRCDSSRRYISTGGCVQCNRERTAGALPPDDEPRLGVVATVVREPGKCQHGVGLRAFCRQCESAWRGRRRFEAVKYNDLVSREPDAVPLNFESL
jgi:hypothetical protein